jgi:hypothetical protein
MIITFRVMTRPIFPQASHLYPLGQMFVSNSLILFVLLENEYQSLVKRQPSFHFHNSSHFLCKTKENERTKVNEKMKKIKSM